MAITVGLDKSVIIELPTDVRDVIVSNPKKLDAVMHSNRRAYLIGGEVGQANAFFFDQTGQQVLSLEVVIERDLNSLAATLHKLVPGSNIRLEAVNDNIVLTGSVPHPSDASRAADIAGRFVGEREKVLNMLAVESKEQVMLKVTVAEMERSILKQFGVDLDILLNSGNIAFAAVTDNPFSIAGAPIAGTILGQTVTNTARSLGAAVPITGGYESGQNRVVPKIRAAEQDGLVRVLAEPTLTAISGESASFLAGGEFPVPVGRDDDRIEIEFKPFGVGLAFTPVVMSEGRISMKVSTEVSELTTDGAFTYAGALGGGITIPALKVRRANTTVELSSGGTMIMAGLISETTKQNINGVPGLKRLPILGALFRSRDFEKSETELVVIVTPYVVNQVARAKVTRPDGGFASASDKKTILFGHLNRIYGRDPEQLPPGGYKGDYGFIVE